MRAITVRQPYAWAIIHGGKDVENRTRVIVGDYRGPLLIHAAKALADESDDRLVEAAAERLSRARDAHAGTLGWRGAIVGIVDLIDVHPATRCAGIHGEHCSPWAQADVKHLVLANPRPLAPIPFRGRLGMWMFPDELLPEGVA